MEWQVRTYDSCQHQEEEGRGGSKKQEFPVSSPCRQPLNFIGEKGSEKRESVRQSLLFLFLSIFLQIFHF